MLTNFLVFLFNMVSTFIGSLLVLRAYIFYQRISVFDPLPRLVWACTNWLVVPLSAVIKPTRRWEWASVVGAFLMALIVVLALAQVTGLPGLVWMIPVSAVFLMLRWMLELMLWAVIIFAVLSWFQTNSPMYAMMWRLVNPFLGPISEKIPTIGRVDISPIIFFVVINCLLYWVTPISRGYMLF